MGWLILVGLIAVIGLLAWVLGWVSRIGNASVGRRRGASGIRGLLPICSQGERVFLAVLESVVPDEMRVLCKVRVADVIETFGADFRTVSQKHFDFVICDAETLMPLLAIELDDKSHLTARQQQSDAVKNSVCERAGLPMLRVVAQAAYDARHLSRCISAELAMCSS
jgi:very-short-patch-repair endonuclease